MLRLGGARLILDEVEGSTTLDCKESGANGYGSPRTGRTVGIVSIGPLSAWRPISRSTAGDGWGFGGNWNFFIEVHRTPWRTMGASAGDHIHRLGSETG